MALRFFHCNNRIVSCCDLDLQTVSCVNIACIKSKSMIIKHYNSRTAQTENNSELELVKIELELKNTKAIAQVKSASIALNTALFVNNIHQVRFNPYSL